MCSILWWGLSLGAAGFEGSKTPDPPSMLCFPVCRLRCKFPVALLCPACSTTVVMDLFPSGTQVQIHLMVLPKHYRKWNRQRNIQESIARPTRNCVEYSWLLNFYSFPSSSDQKARAIFLVCIVFGGIWNLFLHDYLMHPPHKIPCSKEAGTQTGSRVLWIKVSNISDKAF